MKKWLLVTLIVIASILILWRASFLIKFKTPTKYGVTFSQMQAQELGLNWRETYSNILDDLKVKNLRLVAYWDEIERQNNIYDFNDLDWQMSQTETHGAKVILVIGERTPRWPECHIPPWANSLSASDKEEALLNYNETIIKRYKNSSALIMWQVENEPFLEIFGECSKVRNKPLLLKEIAQVRALDPAHPTMITDSGELATWLRGRGAADYFGASVYRVVDSFIGFFSYADFIPAVYYRAKAFLVGIDHHKMIIAEFQAEPWTREGLTVAPQSEQDKTMSFTKFKKDLEFSKTLGFSQVYMWGVEWWYWKKLHGDPSFWEASKALFQP